MNGITRLSKFLNVSLMRNGVCRQLHGNEDLLDNCIQVRNRNPRNLELLRIARKPSGYHLDRQVREYWHTLKVHKSTRYAIAEIHHFEYGPVITVSTKEWAIRRQLYSEIDSEFLESLIGTGLTDTAAYMSVGKVLAQRCLESGISSITCFLNIPEGGKLEALIKEVEKGGVQLKEPERYKHPHPWDLDRPEKPWDPTIE